MFGKHFTLINVIWKSDLKPFSLQKNQFVCNCKGFVCLEKFKLFNTLIQDLQKGLSNVFFLFNHLLN